jgi:hypothetical protein
MLVWHGDGNIRQLTDTYGITATEHTKAPDPTCCYPRRIWQGNPRGGPHWANAGRPEASPIRAQAYGPPPLAKSAALSARD